MDKLYAIKIRQSDGTYGAAIPVSVLAENVDWNSTLSLVDILGQVDTSESIQDQINNLKNTRATQASVNALDQKVDNAVEYITHNSEIADARIGADGVTYQSLGNAIREQVTDLKNQLNGNPYQMPYIKGDGSGMAWQDTFVTPEMYGAVGDGETDDSVALQNAINSGYPIVFTKEYYFTQTLNIPAVNTLTTAKRHIDFGCAKLIYNGSDFAITIGEELESQLEKLDAQIIENLMLFSSNKGVKIGNNTQGVQLKSCSIMAPLIGVQIGDDSKAISVDCKLSYCKIVAKPAGTANSIGILCESYDNYIDNCFVYYFRHQVENGEQSAGTIINNIHTLGTRTYDTVMFYDRGGGTNYLNDCYSDTDISIIDGTSSAGENIVNNQNYFSYREISPIFFNCVKTTIINGATIASANITNAVGVTKDLFNNANKRLYSSWRIHGVKCAPDIFINNTDILLNGDTLCNYWQNPVNAGTYIRLGYICGYKYAINANIEINSNNIAGNVNLYYNKDRGCTVRYKDGNLTSSNSNFYYKVIETNGEYEILEIVMKLTNNVYAPAWLFKPIGISQFAMPINNQYTLTDLPTLTSITGYNNANNIGHRRLIMIGDSYLWGYTGDDHQAPITSWGTYLVNLLGVGAGDYDIRSLGGAGFVAANLGKNFLDLLNDSTISSPETVTDVIVEGGYNDRNSSNDDIKQGILTFVRTAKTKYPNAKIWVGHNGWAKHSDRLYSLSKSVRSYIAGANEAGATYINNIEFSMHRYFTDFCADGVHPNEKGQKHIAQLTADVLQGGGGDIYETFTNYIFTPASDIKQTNLPEFLGEMFNGKYVNVVCQASCTIEYDEGNWKTINCSGDAYIDLGSFSGGYMIGPDVYFTVIPMEFIFRIGNGEFTGKHNGGLLIRNGHLWLYCRETTGSGWAVYNNISKIFLTRFNAQFDSMFC